MYYGHLAYLKSYKIKELMFKSVTVTVTVSIPICILPKFEIGIQ